MSHLTYYTLQTKGMDFIHTGKKKTNNNLVFYSMELGQNERVR